MLINEMSGSGGDMLPYMFRELKHRPADRDDGRGVASWASGTPHRSWTADT